MQRKVVTIPATINKFTAKPVNSKKKRKVAGYARVSTDHEDQLTSYDAQIDYYTNYIKGRDDWEFAGLYSDEGISATNTRHRDGFNKMIEDALVGKIDLIITKSVSRFARNTVDSLSTIRKLKEHNVECYFEKENIWTFDSKGELLITIMSSLAQEESRSISENVTWGQRKRMADGKVSFAYSNFMGLEKGPDGKIVVNKEQAKVVKLIFKLFLEGMTPHAIATELTRRKIKSPAGKDTWNSATVTRMLSNEKYKGDALLQKQFTVDFLSKKLKKNEGEVPQYYVEGNHEAIISPEVFDLVQAELVKRKKKYGSHYSGVSIFSNKIKCGDCGSWYGSKVWHSNDKYRKVIYRCNKKYKGGKCETPHITEKEIKEKFVIAFNKLLSEKDEVLENIELIKSSLFDTAELENKSYKLESQMNVLINTIQMLISNNSQVAQDQEEYQRRYNALVDQYNQAKSEYENAQYSIKQKNASKGKMEKFISTLELQDHIIDEFDRPLWSTMVDFVTIYKDKCTFTFKDGTEIDV